MPDSCLPRLSKAHLRDQCSSLDPTEETTSQPWPNVLKGLTLEIDFRDGLKGLIHDSST